MDRFNVLSITTDINELEKDMEKWSLLPYDFRRRSNDYCIQMYGITVPELYARLRNKIQAIADLNRNDESNLVYENAWEEQDNYQELLNTSKNLQLNAYVVIIDPDITTKRELSDRMNSFNALSKRLKKVSNMYSWQIWGYNVPNMYKLMLNILDTDANTDPYDSSNIVRLDEAYISPIEDYYNNATLNGDILTATKYSNDLDNIIENGDIISKILASKIEENANDTLSGYSLILPKYLPWFTEQEVISKSIKLNIPEDINYYKAVSEAVNNYRVNKSEDNKNAILELGWNPSLDFNGFTLNAAMNRQLEHINSYKYYDITNLLSEDVDAVDTIDNNEIKPIFLVQYGDNVYLSLDSSLKTLYLFNNKYEKVSSNTDLLKSSDVYMALIDNLSYARLEKAVVDEDTINNISNIGTIYTILLNARNKLDPATKLVFFANYIENILNLINCSNNSGILMDYSRLSNKKAIYKVSKAKDDYSVDSVNDLFNLIRNNTKLSKILRSDKAVDKISAEPIIISNDK